MEHETDGDIEEAHATFLRLASNGAAKLPSARLSFYEAEDSPLESVGRRDEVPQQAASNETRAQRVSWGGYADAVDDTVEDRIIRAMRAADALDKETEFLQPLTPDVDLTVKLVDIPPSKKRPSSTVVEGPEIHRGSRPPSPCESQTMLSAEPVPRVLPNTTSAAGPASAAPRKPSLRIHIPSSPIPRAGDVAVGGSRPKVYRPQGPVPEAPSHRRTRTAESNLSPRQRPTTGGSGQEDATAPESRDPLLTQNDYRDPTEPAPIQDAERKEQPFESVLPLLEDLVVFFTPETPNELHDFIFRRLSEGFKTPRQSISGGLIPQHDALQGAGLLAIGEKHNKADEEQAEDQHVSGATPWVRRDLVHGLPTPNHSPNPMDGSSVAMPRMDTRLYSISVGQETAVSIQNFLRSFLGSQFPLQDRRFSSADGGELPAEFGLWGALDCDGQVGSPDGGRSLDLILAVGSESGVTKNRLSEVVGQIEKLGFKTSGLSRSGRLDIRYLIANAMQAFTAQPLTKQTQSNPFADRALLAALIIPHLETYLANHPDVRFLLIEYPSEHLPTILALQTLIGTEVMKVVGIINSEVSTPVQQSLPVSDASRRPSEGFRSLNRRGSRMSGAFVGPCSLSKANFLLASSATGYETAAFVAAIRESLISISDYYIPERPLCKHPALHSPPRNPYPSLTVSTKSSPSTKSPSQNKKETSRISVSTLIITPPSSPTESASPPTHPPHHVNPRSIPPRSSSSTAASTPSRGGPRLYTAYADSPSVPDRVQWGEVNYAAAPSTPTATTNTTTAVDGVATANASRGSTGTHSGGSNSGSKTHIRHHRKQDSDPLSPRAIVPSSSTAASTPQKGKSPAAAAASSYHVAGVTGYDVDCASDSDSDSELAREERRLMPLYLRRCEEIERGRSSKAMKWLGLD